MAEDNDCQRLHRYVCGSRGRGLAADCAARPNDAIHFDLELEKVLALT